MSRSRSHPGGSSRWVLIITDDTNFGRDLMLRWEKERQVPHFTSFTSELWQHAAVAACDLAIVGPVYAAAQALVLSMAASAPAAVAVLPPGVSPREVRVDHPTILPLRMTEDAAEIVVAVGSELLLRLACEEQMGRAEKAASEGQLYAALGRFMVECRHNFNNALTAVLGTAELMQLNLPQSPQEVGEQVKTIQMMAQRLQAMMQRLSAIETEMRYAEQQPRVQAGVLRFPPQEGRGQKR